MKTIEGIDRQHDSFEEINRILVIAEESKKEYEAINTEKKSRMAITIYLPLLLSAISFLLSIYTLLVHRQTVINQLFFFVPFLIFFFFQIRDVLAYNKVTKESKIKYETTTNQATEVLREMIPIISQRENWSAIKKFEISLRLSKLGISPEGILGDRQP